MEGWSLADRRMWNLLLVNAWGDRLEDPMADFEIPLRELRGLHDSNDRVRESLQKLQTTLIAARMGDGKTRTVQMLGACDIDDDDRIEGRLKYDFHRKLVPLLRRSEIYARMETKVLSSFTSKYALALYEALALRINMRRSVEEIDILTLRHWVGVETGKLVQWAHLQQRAVNIAVQEVNALSPYSVEIEPIKRGRKIERVRVTWAKKEPFSPAEQASAREVNRARVGRTARINGKVESVVRELSPEEIKKGYQAAASAGSRIDKYAAYADWRVMVEGFKEPPANPVGHFIDFCKKRARQVA
jgi:plasmid replication initiation protein